MREPGWISRNHLAGILEGYLWGKEWATERRLEGEVYKNHSIEELRYLLGLQEFSYLLTINPQRLDYLVRKFLC